MTFRSFLDIYITQDWEDHFPRKAFRGDGLTLREQVGIACSAGAADIVMHEHEELG